MRLSRPSLAAAMSAVVLAFAGSCFGGAAARLGYWLLHRRHHRLQVHHLRQKPQNFVSGRPLARSIVAMLQFQGR